jgi:hypothetical protein
METQWISAPHDRPRCRALDRHGQRCRQPVLWDEGANRPLSTRCQRHGGLADAALVGRPAAGSTGRPSGPARPLAGLFALVLAGGLCLAMTGPALASFETAVTAYEQGAYVDAQREFQILADAGDDRAKPYLERIRRKLQRETPAEESIATTLESAVTNLFDAPERPRIEPPTVGPAAEPDRSATGRPAGHVEPGGGSGQAPSHSEVVVPRHGSIWSSVYHLPGDATVIGLQYVARFLSADNLGRELQIMSRHSDEIAISVLAGFWWLVIVRGAVGTALALWRVMKAATAPRKEQRYG